MFERYKGRKWVIGVSGGIDSMSLLDMAFQERLDIVVCHVNYQKRRSAIYDEMLVESYCVDRRIPYYAAHAPVDGADYNFQAWARDYRYSFYRDIMFKEGCDGVLIAHHADDFLETAMLREKQGRKVSFYGIQAESRVMGMMICRPLLGLFKEDLYNYLSRMHLEYGQDETNFENEYERNKIRNLVLSNKSLIEKKELLAYYERRNDELAEKMSEIRQELAYITTQGYLPIDYLKQQEEEHAIELLREWLVNYDQYFYEVSLGFLKDVIQFLYSSKKVATKAIGGFYILKEYEYLKVIEQKGHDFCYVIDKKEELNTPFFRIFLKGGSLKEGLTVRADDFPLTIRNVQDGDAIEFSFGHKKIHQYFIDEKIPYEERISWPVVVNRSGEVIFVCNLGSNIKHFSNKPNLFVVK